MTSKDGARDSLGTVGAIALIAMCLTPVSHEAMGHGGTCLALGGRVNLLSSSLFHCAKASPLIDLGGPLGNLLVGGLAVAFGARVSPSRPGLKLFLTLLAAFTLFWEGGYTVQAMIKADGDAYFAARDLLSSDAAWWRVVLGVLGAAIYVLALSKTSRSLLILWPDPAQARRMARIAWVVAVVGSAMAALLYRGPNAARDLHDAITEIGLASVPLLLIPRGRAVEGASRVRLAFRPVTMVVGAVVFGLFAVTLGRGLVLA